MTPPRLAWICFFAILICPSINLVLRQVLPAWPKGFLTGLLWLLTDVNRLLVLAAFIGLIVSAVWGLCRSRNQ